MKDLTNSTIERQNILNNKFALQHIQEYVGIEGMMFEGEFKFSSIILTKIYALNKRQNGFF